MRSEPTILTRLTCLMLAVLMTMAMLSGCGSKAEESQSETTQPAPVETLPVYPEYTAELEPGTEAYAEIVSITPAFRIGDSSLQEETDTETNVIYTDVVCSCVTTQGTAVWVCMPIEEYVATFESSNKPITFAQPLRIQGIVESADALYSGLSAQAGTATMLTSITAEADALRAAMGEDLTLAAFTAEAGSLAPVWVDIVTVAPAYIIDGSNPEIVCECLDVDGNIVWVYMTMIGYTTHFDPAADFGETDAQNLSVITLDAPVRVYGTVRYAADLCSGLQENTGVNTMVLMEFCEAAPVPETTEPVSDEPKTPEATQAPTVPEGPVNPDAPEATEATEETTDNLKPAA